MTTRQQIIDAIAAAVHQLHALTDQIRAQPDTPTRESDWTVREMLCHVAATANYSELFRRVEAADGAFPTLDEMDADNERQRAERANRSIDELVEEAAQGFAAARESVRRLSDERLAQPAPTPDGSAQTIADLIMVYSQHARGHITTLEQAVGATS